MANVERLSLSPDSITLRTVSRVSLPSLALPLPLPLSPRPSLGGWAASRPKIGRGSQRGKGGEITSALLTGGTPLSPSLLLNSSSERTDGVRVLARQTTLSCLCISSDRKRPSHYYSPLSTGGKEEDLVAYILHDDALCRAHASFSLPG